MSKQNLVIIIVIVISLVVGGLFGFYFYLSSKQGINTDNSSSGLNSFFNFGSSKPNPNPPAPSSPSETATTTPVITTTVPLQIPLLRHLTIAPTAGSAFIDKEIIASSTVVVGTTTRTTTKVVGTSEVMRWIDRATGNIFETASSTLETTRISNITIPKVYEAFFVNSKGTSMIFRGLANNTDVIETKYGLLQDESATSSTQIIKTNDLPLNITQIALSPDKSQIFSILPSNVRGVISNADGSSQTNVFNSSFHEWLVSWPLAQTVILNTKPSGDTEGYAYTFNTRTRVATKLIGNKKGLTTLMSPDGNYTLVGESPLGTMKLDVLDNKTSEVKDLFIRTIPEKCVWSKKQSTVVYCAIPEDVAYNTYPDAWYMGKIAFSDSLWSINVVTNESRRIVQPATLVNQTIDMTNLSLNKNEDFLMFQDKNDLSIWSYQLVVASSTPVVVEVQTQ